jgi:hypothetical protein
VLLLQKPLLHTQTAFWRNVFYKCHGQG